MNFESKSFFLSPPDVSGLSIEEGDEMHKKKGFYYVNACLSHLAIFIKSFEIHSLFLFELLFTLTDSHKTTCLKSILTKNYSKSIKWFYAIPYILIAFSFFPIYKDNWIYYIDEHSSPHH